MFQPVFQGLYAEVADSAAGSGFRFRFRFRFKFTFKDKLVNIDFTVIDPSLSMEGSVKYQRTKGAVRYGQH